MTWASSHIKCTRCGHFLTRRKYAREPVPHKATQDGFCVACRDCYIIWDTQGRPDHGRAQSPRPPGAEDDT
jgi:hypothetical protein